MGMPLAIAIENIIRLRVNTRESMPETQSEFSCSYSICHNVIAVLSPCCISYEQKPEIGMYFHSLVVYCEVL